MVWVLVGLCVVGFGISSYFTGVAYHWVRPDTRWIPAVCRMGKQTCATIVFTFRAESLEEAMAKAEEALKALAESGE